MAGSRVPRALRLGPCKTSIFMLWPFSGEKFCNDTLHYITGYWRHYNLTNALGHDPAHLLVRYLLIQLYSSQDSLSLHWPGIGYGQPQRLKQFILPCDSSFVKHPGSLSDGGSYHHTQCYSLTVQ